MKIFFKTLIALFLMTNFLASLPVQALESAEKTVKKSSETLADKPVLDLENTLYLDLKDGQVVIEMYPKTAPKHVARIKELVRQGFYDGLTFHRVIPGFMAQGGDPKGTGIGGSGQNIPAEFSDKHHIKGTLSMARATDINSADSQFFIVLDVSTHLDGKYTIWGRVMSGMKYVDRIKQGVVPELTNPDKIIKMQVAADVVKNKVSPDAVKSLDSLKSKVEANIVKSKIATDVVKSKITTDVVKSKITTDVVKSKAVVDAVKK